MKRMKIPQSFGDLQENWAFGNVFRSMNNLAAANKINYAIPEFAY